jgi:hypothetical protein
LFALGIAWPGVHRHGPARGWWLDVAAAREVGGGVARARASLTLEPRCGAMGLMLALSGGRGSS